MELVHARHVDVGQRSRRRDWPTLAAKRLAELHALTVASVISPCDSDIEL